jgi:CubicO group peptidase (beta-lactamase class C family)
MLPRSTVLTITCLFLALFGKAEIAMGQNNEDSELTRIAAKIDAIREKHGMASAYLVLVDRDETLLSKGMGIRTWEDTRAVDDESYYRLGSITKAFTGLAMLKAEEQGCLLLTDPVAPIAAPYIYKNNWEDTHPLTAAMFMEHTAGIHEMSREEFDFNDVVSLEDALHVKPESRTTAWQPGTHSEYSNSGPGVAGWLLQQGCNKDFDRFIEENVFRALDMPSATLNRTDEVAETLVGGYNTDPKEPIEYWNFIFRPAGAANVKPVEMGNFVRMLLNRGVHDGKAIFTPQQIDRMETPTTTIAANAGLDYGYGLGIYAENKRGHVFFGHGGDADGYLSRFSYSKESGKGFFVVITMFDFKPMREMRDVLEAWMLQDLPAHTLPEGHELSEERIASIIGTYNRATVRFPREDWQRETLIVSRRGQRIGYECKNYDWCELVPVTDELFRGLKEPVATKAIVATDGQMILQGAMGNWSKQNE